MIISLFLCERFNVVSGQIKVKLNQPHVNFYRSHLRQFLYFFCKQCEHNGSSFATSADSQSVLKLKTDCVLNVEMYLQ